MATIRHSLQRDVFEPTEERLIGVLYVTKPGKKKKTSFLCATINKEKPVSATVHQVKKTDKDIYKKKNSWLLRELQVVDGRDENKDTAELDLTFDRVYKWVANSTPDKNAFIQVLWKLCCRYLPKQKPQFINIPSDLIEENAAFADSGDVTTAAFDTVEAALEDEGDYRALSEKEQLDLERLMEQCDSAVSNAEAFAEQLSRDLSVLDGANIHSMMASEAQVEALMDMIDAAYTEAEKIESRLDSYDEILQHVKDSIEKMADKNTSIEQTNANNSKLLEELDKLINQLELHQRHQQVLLEADLNKTGSLPQIIEAATALQTAISAPIPMHLSQLQAVQDQKKRFEKLKSRFSQIISRHLNNLFIHLGNDPGETLSLHAEQLTLPRHGSIHTELSPYTPLMHWVRALDHKAYQHLNKTYANSISKLYERDIRLFFEEARQRISGGRRLRGSGSSQDLASMAGVAGKLTSQIKHGAQTLSTRTTTGALLGVDRDLWGSELDMQERQKFDEIFERVLSELQPVCLAEQEFCIAFFNLNAAGTEKAPSSVASTPGSSGSEESSGSAGTSSGGGAAGTPGQCRLVNREVRAMMVALFTTLEQQLNSFINTYDRADSYCCLYIYVRLSEHVLTAEDTGSFLSTTFGSCLVQAKRNFDRFMNSQLQSIQECRVTKKKCGIIPFINNFEDFCHTAESVFKKSERRADLDKWYVRLVMAMFEHIPRVAGEHQRTPPEVIKMENYHVLHQLMFQLKLPGMDAQRKEAKQRYQEALNAYVTQYFGRPLEKLNLFFDGVTAKVAGGVKESEVGYQLAFSKQELRKVIKEYPGKEVKRGLDQLYKKVEKHLSEEGNLLQVVWRAMQEEFIRQYKLIEDLIHRCYPGAMINLEFSIDDILNYFSDIAQSH
ncbi:exocyst complex component 1 [Macrobrachium rosenbergii]|uniref:exocyst complex component 1 n=1 Tax=Macrobrachium rosenbergii TaxID=79674 RepID=UPI0034D4804E